MGISADFEKRSRWECRAITSPWAKFVVLTQLLLLFQWQYNAFAPIVPYFTFLVFHIIEFVLVL